MPDRFDKPRAGMVGTAHPTNERPHNFYGLRTGMKMQ